MVSVSECPHFGQVMVLARSTVPADSSVFDIMPATIHAEETTGSRKNPSPARDWRVLPTERRDRRDDPPLRAGRRHRTGRENRLRATGLHGGRGCRTPVHPPMPRPGFPLPVARKLHSLSGNEAADCAEDTTSFERDNSLPTPPSETPRRMIASPALQVADVKFSRDAGTIPPAKKERPHSLKRGLCLGGRASPPDQPDLS